VAKLEEANLSGKRIAIFGLGDQVNYPASFVDAIGILYDIVIAKGATVVGFMDPTGFDFTESKALRDGRFVGLALDEDNQASKSDARIGAWLTQLT
jgi:flavodoxin I